MYIYICMCVCECQFESVCVNELYHRLMTCMFHSIVLSFFKKIPPASPFFFSLSCFHVVSIFLDSNGYDTIHINTHTHTRKKQTNKQTTIINTPILLVTIPDGVKAGQTIHVQAPDGRLNAVIVPDGFGPGDVFTVEFATTTTATADTTKINVNPNKYDTGSNVQPATSTTTTTSNAEPEVYLAASQEVPDYDGNNSSNNYPSAMATPVYSPPPEYPTATTLGGTK